MSRIQRVRRNWQPGSTYGCGNPPTNGQEHQSVDGEHVATVLGYDEARDRYEVRCACGHEWHVPCEEDVWIVA